MTAAISRFFLRIGQAKTATERRCEWTAPLFPLALILDADGTLAQDARHLVGDKRITLPAPANR